MSTLFLMEKILVDDRTTETQEQKLEREVFAAGQLLVGFTIQVCGARPAVGLGALTFALGMGAARVGASLDEILKAVRMHYDATEETMRDEIDDARSTRPADA